MMGQSVSASNLGRQSLPPTGWLDRLGLVILCLMPICTFLGIAVCDIAISSIGLLFLLRSLLVKDWRWCRQTWVIFAVLAWAFLVVRSPFAVVSTKDAFHQALPFGRFIFFAAALQTWLLVNQNNQKYLLKALAITLTFIGINTLFSFVTGFTVLGQNGLLSAEPHHGLIWFWDRPYTRLRGINGKLNDGILMSWMAIPMFMDQFLRLREPCGLGKWLQVTSIVLLVILAIIMTGERMAMLELGMGLLLAILLVKSLRRQLFIVLPFIVLVCLLFVLYNKGIYNRQVGQVVGATDHFFHTSYGGILLTAWAIFKSHWVFGVGLKQYEYVSSLPQFASLHGQNTHAQNLYLQWLIGTGIVGTTLFLGMMGCWIRQFWRHRKLVMIMPILAGVLIAWFQRIWPLASTTSFFFSWGAITFWWMGAWALAIVESSKLADSAVR